MLDGRFTERQLEAVVAHEYGHQARHHLPKGIAWYALFTIPLAYLIAVVARRRGGMQRPEAIPLVLLVFVVFGLLKTPLEAAITRHMEAEADWMALETTRDARRCRRSSSGSRRRASATRARRPRPTWSSTTTRPSCSGSLWLGRGLVGRGCPEPPANS